MQDVEPGSDELVAPAPSGQGVVLAVVGSRTRDAAVVVDYDGHESRTIFGAGQSGSTNDTVADGGTVTVRVQRGVLAEGDRVRVAFYVQAG